MGEEKNKTKNAVDSKKKKTKTKLANEYTNYWDISGEHESKIMGDRPKVRIFISKQKRGTETAAEPYKVENNATKKTTNNNENNAGTTGNTTNQNIGEE